LKGIILRKQKNKNHNSSKHSILDHNKAIEKPEDIIVGFKNRLKPRTINQKDYIRTVAENTITFCQGVAGSGKTHIAVGMALEYLIDHKVKKVVITRPVVEAGEKLGFLPGTAEEKLHPYLLPLFDEINYFLSTQHRGKLHSNHQIEIVPLGLMRGRSFHNSFIVADECQNASYDQLKMLLTRIGMESKMILTGDIEQSDLEQRKQGGFETIINRLQDTKNIGFSHLEAVDIIRNPIIADIIYKLQ
jgi:phosphate starvation-inducible protein PhoH and related proteins